MKFTRLNYIGTLLVCFVFVFLLVDLVNEHDDDIVEYVITSKTIDMYKGTTRYNLAFECGHSTGIGYGYWLQYELGDTITLIKQHNSVIWKVEDNKLKK